MLKSFIAALTFFVTAFVLSTGFWAALTGEVLGVGQSRPGEGGESGLPGLPGLPGLVGLPGLPGLVGVLSRFDSGLLLPDLRLMLMGAALCSSRWETSLTSPCSLAESTASVPHNSMLTQSGYCSLNVILRHQASKPHQLPLLLKPLITILFDTDTCDPPQPPNILCVCVCMR